MEMMEAISLISSGLGGPRSRSCPVGTQETGSICMTEQRVAWGHVTHETQLIGKVPRQHLNLLPGFFVDLYNWLLPVAPYRKHMQRMRVGTREKAAERNCRRDLKGM